MEHDYPPQKGTSRGLERTRCSSQLQYEIPQLAQGHFLSLVFSLQIATKQRADERTQTADLISLRVIIQALHGFA